jgi:hypothetical protein
MRETRVNISQDSGSQSIKSNLREPEYEEGVAKHSVTMVSKKESSLRN